MPVMFVIALIALGLALAALLIWRAYAKTVKRVEAELQKVEASKEDRSSTRPTSRFEDDYYPRSKNGATEELKERLENSAGFAWLAKVAAFVLLAIFAVLMGFSSITIISTKNVGVVTEFGSPIGTLDNGLHLIAPWQKVTELDGTIQTDSHAETQVRLANQGVAYIDNSVRWRIVGEYADDLFRDYRDSENIRDSLVTRELDAALNTVFEDYDPLATNDDGELSVPGLEELSNELTATLQNKVGDGVEVLSVIITKVKLDDTTQSRLNALQTEIANTRIAEQSALTAEAEALANEILSDSVSEDPNVLVSKCMDLLQEMISANMAVPPAFSCWPGSQSALVLPSATNPPQ
jgi:regulator of protease activity HflC (stomatin/prohibitin superfamily)